MAITIGRGLRSRIRENPGSIVVQVQGAEDTTAATEALRRARAEIWDLDGGWRSAPGLGPGDRNDPKYVGEPMPAGTGPWLTVDGGHVPIRLLLTIPDIVARHLAEAGVTDAVVGYPPPGWYYGGGQALYKVPRAALAGLYPPPPPLVPYGRIRAEIPDAWLEEAARWVRHGLGERDELGAAVETVDFPLSAADVPAFLAECRRSRPGTSHVVAGDLATRLRGVNGCYIANWGVEPMLFLAAGGPEANDDELLAAFSELQDVVRRLADGLGYAFVSIEPSFRTFAFGHPNMRDYREGRENPAEPDTVALLCDQLVLDGFAYQVLGPGHLGRLGGPPPGAVALSGGRVEVAVGDPTNWLPNNPARPVVRRSARQVLEACLLGARDAELLLKARQERDLHVKPPEAGGKP